MPGCGLLLLAADFQALPDAHQLYDTFFARFVDADIDVGDVLRS
jgi:hypothetical protein